MATRKKKVQISAYLDQEVMAALADYAARRDQSLSLIAEAAIASFLSPDAAERREAATARRLDQLDRRLSRLERDMGIAVETLAVFVRFRLTTTPALPEPAARAARAKAGERYEVFVAALGRRLAGGPKLRQEISEDVEPEARQCRGPSDPARPRSIASTRRREPCMIKAALRGGSDSAPYSTVHGRRGATCPGLRIQVMRDVRRGWRRGSRDPIQRSCVGT